MTTDAVKILKDRYIGDDPERNASLEEEREALKETDMVNGRDTMMKSIESELISIDSMRKAGIKNIKYAQDRVNGAQANLREVNELQARLEQQTEMCWKLQNALEEFGAGLESLKAT